MRFDPYPKYSRHPIFSCLALSIVAGVFTGVFIFLFKISASGVITLSSYIYSYVREDISRLPLILTFSVILATLAYLLLLYEPDCRGGGIPTAICYLRGLITFRWLRNIIFIFLSSMLTYLCAVPLGTEGPSVQMGTAAGKAAVSLFSKNHPAWERYIMTGGACAGFAVVTGAPLTGILFAFEEAHRRFSPLIFIVSSTTVISSTIVMRSLCSLFGLTYSLFHIDNIPKMPPKDIWIALVIGLVCGLVAILFTRAYRSLRVFIVSKMAKIPLYFKVVFVFVISALVGYFIDECIGSGHGLTDTIIGGEGIWYMLVIYFLIRALLLIIANNVGVTGGLFVPILAFGAIIGAVIADGAIAVGIMSSEYFTVCVLIGIASFLAACSHIPLIAISFSFEVLSAYNNPLPFIIAVTIAFFVIEGLGVTAFTDVVMDSKVEKVNGTRSCVEFDQTFVVKDGAFICGKAVRDILWPPQCVVLLVGKDGQEKDSYEVSAGDILHVYATTYDKKVTFTNIENMVGKQ